MNSTSDANVFVHNLLTSCLLTLHGIAAEVDPGSTYLLDDPSFLLLDPVRWHLRLTEMNEEAAFSLM